MGGSGGLGLKYAGRADHVGRRHVTSLLSHLRRRCLRPRRHRSRFGPGIHVLPGGYDDVAACLGSPGSQPQAVALVGGCCPVRAWGSVHLV